MKIFRLAIVIFLLMASLVACRLNPVINVSASTVTIESITPTPSPLATFTQQPNTCLADDELPAPDIPENYIGWKPGVDFAELYSKENSDGKYMYWESLLNGHSNFSIAGYKRGDNSYMFFIEKVICHDTNNRRIYEVVEAARTRPLSEDEDIAPLNFVCHRLGIDGVEIEEEVFAIVNETNGEAVFAWHLVSENMEIKETSLERIKCLSSGIVAPSN